MTDSTPHNHDAPTANRRSIIRAAATAGTAAVAGLAGCLTYANDDEEEEPENSHDDAPIDELEPSELPDGAYVPRHTDPMQMIGMTMDGGVHVSLSYTTPHEFYTVTGDRTSEASVQPDDTMHLMVSVWDSETGLTAPDVEPTIQVAKDGEELTEFGPWPMLSQPMGFHFGDNVTYGGSGEYSFEVSLSASSATMPDDLAERFQGRTVEFAQTFDPADALELETTWNEESYGEPGATDPMQMEMGEMSMATPQQPAFEELPGDVPESQYTDDVGLTVAIHDDPAALGAETDAEQYLVVSTQTRYNRYMVPNAQLEATVPAGDGGSETVDLGEGLHADYGHYYGAGVSGLASGDEVEVAITTPSQVTRHAGYEKAFFDHEPLTVTL